MPTMTMTQKAASDIAHAQKLVDEILAKEENPTKRRLLRGVMAAYRRQHLHYLKLPDEKALAAIRADKYYSSMTHLPGSDERLRQDVLHIASMKAAEKPAPKPKQPKPKQSKPKPKPKPKASTQPRRSRGRLLTSTKPEYPRLSVRARAYRGMDVYVIAGRDTINRNVSIFVRTKQEASRIKRDLLAGEPVRFDSDDSGYLN